MSNITDPNPRRSSSRSIKRKRFDDEIVEYMLPSPVSRAGRPKAQSYASLSIEGLHAMPPQPSASSSLQAASTTTASIATTSAVTQSMLIRSPVTTTTAPSAKLSMPALVAPLHIQAASPATVQKHAPATAQTPSLVYPHQQLKPSTPVPPQIARPSISLAQHQGQSNVANAVVSSPIASIPSSIVARDSMIVTPLVKPPAAGGTPFLPLEKRLKSIVSKSSSKKKKTKSGHQIATKDLGRWKPIDDLALIIGVQQTNDLRMVHRGTKFSCKFTIQEMQNRWYSLLYDESISRIAVAAMRNLHPELVENVQSRALFSTQEEEILGTIKSTDSPTLETFQELLLKNAATFYAARNAKALQTHWQLMKQYLLLPDQVVKYPTKDQVLGFSDTEDMLNDAELAEPRDETLEVELALIDRRQKKEIRHLENELGRWNVLVDSLTSVGMSPEFDRQTLAVLRGRLVRYLMRSREITLGRSTKDSTVDVDLSLEGPAFKISRKQSTIKLRSNADFFMTNEGRRPIFVDGMALLTGHKTRLSHNCVIEISGLRFIFLVNFDLINAIQQESAKMNIPLT